MKRQVLFNLFKESGCLNDEYKKEIAFAYIEAIGFKYWAELIEEKGLYERKDIDNFDYINFLKKSYKDLKLGKLDWEKERRNIYGAENALYLFNHINDVPFDEKGNLLDTAEAIKLAKLFDTNRYR